MKSKEWFYRIGQQDMSLGHSHIRFQETLRWFGWTVEQKFWYDCGWYGWGLQ